MVGEERRRPGRAYPCLAQCFYAGARRKLSWGVALALFHLSPFHVLIHMQNDDEKPQVLCIALGYRSYIYARLVLNSRFKLHRTASTTARFNAAVTRNNSLELLVCRLTGEEEYRITIKPERLLEPLVERLVVGGRGLTLMVIHALT